jgi:DNA-binding NarL/FixJ family response regulator
VTIRVVIVDDEELVRTGLRAILGTAEDIEVVGEAEDGAAVRQLVLAVRPDIVLMDVRMPHIDGIAATRHLLSTVDEPPKVLVINTFENDGYVYEALQAGASGFLLKRARPAELLEAIRVVSRGESLLFPEAVRRLVAICGGAAGDRLDKVGLTEREAETLRLVAAGLSNAEIAGRLFVSLETVKTHVGNVLAKLGARDRTQAVIAAYESGFITPTSY